MASMSACALRSLSCTLRLGAPVLLPSLLPGCCTPSLLVLEYGEYLSAVPANVEALRVLLDRERPRGGEVSVAPDTRTEGGRSLDGSAPMLFTERDEAFPCSMTLPLLALDGLAYNPPLLLSFGLSFLICPVASGGLRRRTATEVVSFRPLALTAVQRMPPTA